MSMLNGTEILIGFNCKFWAMENSNESVHLSNISSKTETDRDRERWKGRESQKYGRQHVQNMQFACKPAKATAKIKPNEMKRNIKRHGSTENFEFWYFDFNW